jgi:hypothetical protein
MKQEQDNYTAVPLTRPSFDELPSKENEEVLPAPVTSSSGSSKPRLSAAVIIPVWIVLSSTVILYNNYVLNTLNFKYPVFLVTWHLLFAVSVRNYSARPLWILTDTELVILSYFNRRLAPVSSNARRTSSMVPRMYT